MSSQPVDITPPNKGKFIWSEGGDENLDKFEQEWSLKPVAVKGVFDHSKEIQIEKERNGEKGV